MEISNLIIQLPWRAQTEPSKVIIYYISHPPGVCVRSPKSMSSWTCVIENHREYTVLFTVYELCLPCMVSSTALSALRKKTDNSGWKGGAMDGRQRMRKERERGGGRKHGVKEQASMMSLKPQGFISQTAMQQLSREIVKHFTLGFFISPHLSFLFYPARFLFLSVILARVRASVLNLCCSFKQKPKLAAFEHWVRFHLINIIA